MGATTETDPCFDANRFRILVIEDDPATAAGVVRGLRRAGFEVELATNGRQGLDVAAKSLVDLIVLDLMLPELDGEDVLSRLRARSPIPIIVVTARTELETRVSVFELGAVDYLPKPFFVEELVARVQARLGRTRADVRSVRFGSAVLDLTARSLEVDGEFVHLTPTELALLVYLIDRPGRAIARSELALTLSEIDDGRARNLDAHLARLRKKLGGAAGAIVTVWGYGYRFERHRVDDT